MKREMNLISRPVHVLMLCAALLVGQGIFAAPARAQANAEAPEKVWIDGRAEPGIDPDAPLRFSSLANLAAELSPAVVNLIVTYDAGSAHAGIFGAPQRKSRRLAQGSGFIIHPDGYILTNYHVVNGADEVKVRLLDKSEFDGHIVGVDPQTDVALLKIEAKQKLEAIALGDSAHLRAGEHVLAIGNPMGLSHTVTTGIISALDRRDLGIQEENYVDFIQTDASINPGNSGGPLISLSGEVIGINTAINRHGQGIGFAIPIRVVKTILPHLAKTGYVVRSWLGVRVQPLDMRLANSFGLESATGAVVTEVVAESPAARGGLKVGDVVLGFDNDSLDSGVSLRWLSSTAGAGRVVDIDVLRDGERRTLAVKMGKLPDQTIPKIPGRQARVASTNLHPEFGVEVEPLTRSLADELGASGHRGVVVTKVGTRSSANIAGLRRKDVIIEVGNAEVADSSEFDNALNSIVEGQFVRLKVLRDGYVVYLAVRK
ncbi:serine protease Do [Bradymonas sediminis]|nr:serine protease Do [Bradymonas sediminis]